MQGVDSVFSSAFATFGIIYLWKNPSLGWGRIRMRFRLQGREPMPAEDSVA